LAEKVGLAIIGSTGIIGRVHIDAIAQLDSCRVVGINARRQELLRQQALEQQVAMYATLEEVLEDQEVDAIVIATPHPSHLEITQKAAAAGKHILAEKPMGVTPSDADGMISAAKSGGVKLGVLFNNRFRPEAIKAKQLIEEGAIGAINRVSMSSVMLRSQDYYDRLEWRGRWDEEGGGVLINQGIHSIDMMQWLTGMPTSVFGHLSIHRHKVEVEDYATAVMQYEGGGHGTFHCTTAQAPNQQRIEIWGEKGALILDHWVITLHSIGTSVTDFIENNKDVAFNSPDVQTEVFGDFEQVPSTHVPAIDDFARAILEDREPAITGKDGLRSQELVAALTLSGCREKLVSLPIDRAEYDTLMDELRSTRRMPGR